MSKISSIQNLVFAHKQNQVHSNKSAQANPSVTLKSQLNADTFSLSPSFKADLVVDPSLRLSETERKGIEIVRKQLARVDNNAIVSLETPSTSAAPVSSYGRRVTPDITIKSQFYGAETENGFVLQNPKKDLTPQDIADNIMMSIDLCHAHTLRPGR